MIGRRLQSIGGGSLSLTLPKKWILENKLKSKDTINLEQLSDGSLMVRRNGHNRKIYKYLLDAQKMSLKEITREIIGAYMTGVDELTINIGEYQTGLDEKVKSTVQELMGEEIVENTGDKIVMRNLLDNDKLPTFEAVKKLFKITKGIMGEMYTAVVGGETDVVKALIERDNDADSLYEIICRQMMIAARDGLGNKEMVKVNPFFYHNLAINLERIADHAVNIGRYFLQIEEISTWMDERMPGEIWQGLSLMLKDAEKAVMEKNKSVAHEVLNQDEKLQREIRGFGTTKYQKKAGFALVLTSIWRLRGYIANIAEITIDYVIGQKTQTQENYD